MLECLPTKNRLGCNSDGGGLLRSPSPWGGEGFFSESEGAPAKGTRGTRLSCSFLAEVPLCSVERDGLQMVGTSKGMVPGAKQLGGAYQSQYSWEPRPDIPRLPKLSQISSRFISSPVVAYIQVRDLVKVEVIMNPKREIICTRASRIARVTAPSLCT